MLNIPVSSEKRGYEISAIFYQLSRPLSQRNSNDLTQYYCPVVKSPQTNIWYLRMPNDNTILMNALADKTIMDATLAPFIRLGVLTDRDKLIVQNGIEENRGKYTKIMYYVPDYWIAQAAPDSIFDPITPV